MTLTRMQCGDMLGHSIIFEHMQEGGFASIVQTKED